MLCSLIKFPKMALRYCCHGFLIPAQYPGINTAASKNPFFLVFQSSPRYLVCKLCILVLEFSFHTNYQEHSIYESIDENNNVTLAASFE